MSKRTALRPVIVIMAIALIAFSFAACAELFDSSVTGDAVVTTPADQGGNSSATVPETGVNPDSGAENETKTTPTVDPEPAHTHTFAEGWSKDDEYHWHAATCVHATEVKDKAAHAWDNGVITTPAIGRKAGVKTFTCIACGATRKEDVEATVTFSEGLTFALKEDGTYEVTGIGTCTDTVLVIPETYNGKAVTSIWECAFLDGCGAVTSITIPSGVTMIEESALECVDWDTDTSALVSLIVDENNLTYESIDGVLYTKGGKTLVRYPTGKEGAFTIPEGVTAIDASAFADCFNLTSVTIPTSTTSISRSAFYSCKSLTSVTFVQGSRLETIGQSSFARCGLLSLTIPEGVAEIAESAFNGCENLASVSIPSSLKRIGQSAFWEDYQLTAVSYEGSLAEWCGIDGLIYVMAYNVMPVSARAKKVLYIGGEKAEGILRLPNGLTEIKVGAFCYCFDITGVYLPKSLMTVESYAFYDFPTPISVYYEGNAEDSERVSIRSDSLDSSWYYYSETAPTTEGRFWHYGEIGEIVIWKIGQECSHHYEGVITDPTCTAGGYTTYTCSRCGDRYVKDETATLGHDYQGALTAPTCTAGGCTTYTCSRCGDGYVGDETAPLGHAYGDLIAETPATCVSTGTAAHYECSRCGGLFDSDKKATTALVLVLAIDPDTHLFAQGVCTLCGMRIPSEGLDFSLKEDGTYEVTGIGSCTDCALVIPDVYNDRAVTSVAAEAFFENESIISVSFPSEVVEIGMDAFCECRALVTLTFAATTNLTIGDGAFYGCIALEEVVLPEGLVEIGDSAFCACEKLETVCLPASIETISEWAFDMSALTTVYYAGSAADKAAIAVEDGNDVLEEATWHCLALA